MAQTPTTRVIAAAVRAEIARANLTGRALALRLGWSTSRMARRLSGETDFTVDELTQLAYHLDVPLSTFLPEPVAAVAS